MYYNCYGALKFSMGFTPYFTEVIFIDQDYFYTLKWYSKGIHCTIVYVGVYFSCLGEFYITFCCQWPIPKQIVETIECIILLDYQYLKLLAGDYDIVSFYDKEYV